MKKLWIIFTAAALMSWIICPFSIYAEPDSWVPFLERYIQVALFCILFRRSVKIKEGAKRFQSPKPISDLA